MPDSRQAGEELPRVEEPPRVDAAGPRTGPPMARPVALPSPPVPAPPPRVSAARVSRGAPGAGEAVLPEPPAPSAPPRVGAGEPRLEAPAGGLDPLEALFGDPWLRRASDRPVIVLASKPLEQRFEYLELLKRVIREVYRVSSRAPPLVQHVARRMTEYQLAMMRGGAAIYVVEADSIAEAEAGGAALGRLVSTLEDRLREAYAQGFGFLVVYASRAVMQRIVNLWRPSLSAAGMVYTRLPRPVEARIREDPAVFRVVEAMYSLRPGSLAGAESLDDAVTRAEEMLYSCLESLANDPSLGRVVRPAIDDEEARPDDAFLHYALKAAAVAQLLEAGYRLSQIDTEVGLSNIPVDVVARRGWSGGLVVEAETLTGTLNPAARLSTVAARITSMGYDLWIVVPPLTASVYKPYLEPLLVERERLGTGPELYTVSPASCSLVSLEEHYRRLDGELERLAPTPSI